LIINLTFDQSTGSLPAGFVAAIDAVAQFYENTFTNPITINIDVGFGEIAGQSLENGALGESETYFNNYSYSQIKTALAQNATSADQVSAANSLPANDPTNGGNYWVATAEAKALGLAGASSDIDGYVGFSNSFPFTYNTTNGGTVASGTYDFFGVAAHEFSEVMGRELFVGDDGIGSNSYTPLDLFHYSSNGVRDFSGTTHGYFSPDGGTTDLDNFNTNSGGDFGDWASSAGNDAFLAFSNSGVGNAVSQADINEMNVLGYDETPTTPVNAPGTFAVVGDFTGGSDGGIVWESAANTPTMWLMDGSTVAGQTTLPTPPSSWRLIATGDFNGNGMSDLLWQNTSGQPAIWMMNGSSIVSAVALPNPTTAWQVIATGDFSGNGKDDILWQNTNGQPAIWMMNGTSIVSMATLPNPGTSWHIAATGDFNGDGKTDILWQNTNGQPAIWEMNGTSIASAAALVAPPSSWHIVGTGDFNGDGKSDILWQNSDGTPAIWEMNGTSIVSAVALSNPGSAWKLLGAGNFYGTGDNDLLFVNTGTDQVQIWAMNGTQVSSVQTPASSGAALASSPVTPLSSTPMLTQADAYYPATGFGTAGSPGAPALGGGAYGPGPVPVLGAAPSADLGARGSASDPPGTARGLLTSV
jgi:hypothetical protein